jgi:hypothetical protein
MKGGWSSYVIHGFDQDAGKPAIFYCRARSHAELAKKIPPNFYRMWTDTATTSEERSLCAQRTLRVTG